MFKMNSLLLVMAVMMSGLAFAGSASADCDTPGFLAQMAAPVIGCQAAQAGDAINARGHFVEAGVAAGANAIVPGSGPFVSGGFALQQSGALNAFNQPQSGMPVPQQNFGVPVPQTGFGMPMQQARFMPMPQVRFGNFCVLVNGAIVGPGIPLPIGSWCNVSGIPGQIVQ